MRRITILSVLCVALCVMANAQPKTPKEYLDWFNSETEQVDSFAQWQQQTGTLPPDFSKLPKSNLLPDPLTFLDGRKVLTASDWKERRAEIFSIMEDFITGHFPPKPKISHVEVLSTTDHGTYVETDVKVWYLDDKASVRVRTDIPKEGAAKLPVLIGTSLGGQASSLIRRQFISVGYAGNDGMDDAAVLKDLYPDYDFATLPRRAWLIQVVLDYMETVDRIDMDHVALTGYSRDGKMVAIAGAIDERISAIIAGSTGVGGYVPWRLSGERGGGESIESTTRMYPDWLKQDLRFFVGQEDRIPFDGNLLAALLAPRSLMMEWGHNDEVANGFAQEQAYLSAQKVFELLGAPDAMGIISVDGFHGSNDAEACLDWLDWQFGRSDRRWENEFHFAFDFNKWKKESGESIDPSVRKSPALSSFRNVSDWEAAKPGITASMDWLLGTVPPKMAPAAPGGGFAFFGMMGDRPGPVEIGRGDTKANPGQLVPDIPSWVTSRNIREFGWWAPQKENLKSKRVSMGGISGDIFYPSDLKDGETRPAVIWLHGYHYPMGYMWVYHNELHPILALVEAGYVVLAYDQTGFGTRYKEATHFYERWPHWSRMGKMLEDISAAVDQLEKEPLVEKGNISVFGFTMGGTLGLYAAAKDARIKNVVSVCGFTPMRTDKVSRGTSGATRYSHLYGLIPRIGLYENNEENIPVDFNEVMALVAPRSVLVVQPNMDRDAWPQEVSAAVEQARGIYKLYGASDNLAVQLPTDYGRLSDKVQKAAIEWLKSKTN